MPHIDNFFDDPYLKAANLEGEDRTLTIDGVRQEEVGASKDKRPVLTFREVKKGLVLNKTNAGRIKALYGAEVTAWVGKQVILYPSETDFGGETVECIRVRQHPPVETSQHDDP